MITIVDYDAGNLRSVKRACDAVGIDSVLCRDPDELVRASRIVFPGVGAATSAMETLTARGLGQALKEAVRRGTPTLGICLGTQIVLDSSEESPDGKDLPCLGILPGRTVRFRLSDPRLKVPHMGWNEIRVVRPHPLLAGFQPGDEVYFVHSFYPSPKDPERVHATADYGGDFCCALGKDNVFATQFHPEKSGPVGLDVLGRFARWEGTP